MPQAHCSEATCFASYRVMKLFEDSITFTDIDEGQRRDKTQLPDLLLWYLERLRHHKLPHAHEASLSHISQLCLSSFHRMTLSESLG